VQEQEAAKHVLATMNLSQGKAVVKEIGNTTIAVISASAARQNGGRLQLPVSKGTGQAVEIKSSMLQELAGGAPVAVTLSEVNGNILAVIADASKKGEAKAVSPVISISLFDSSGNHLTVNNLKDPIVLTLQANATPGASCAYWDDVEGKWSQKGMQRVLDANNTNGLVCSSNHLTIFAAVVGFLVDMSVAVVCSNAGAIYSLEGVARLRQGDWWKQVPATALWIYLLAMLLSVVAAGLWDRHQLNQKYRWRGDHLVLIDSLEDEVTSIPKGDSSPPSLQLLQRKLRFHGKALAGLMDDIFCLPLKALLRLIRGKVSKNDRQAEESRSLAEKLLQRNLLNIQASHVGLCVDSYLKITQSLAGDQLKSDFMTKVATQFSTSLSIEKKAEASKQIFLHSHWPYRLLLLFKAYHPIANIFRLSLYTPHVIRVFSIYLNLLGSAAFAALYYKGGALSRDSNPEVCLQNPESLESKLARAIGVAVFSGVFSTAIAFMLSYLSGAFNLHQKDLDNNDEDECELRLAKRNIRTTFFWLLSLSYGIFSCFTICAFIAYAADSFVNNWALSSLMSLLKDAFLSPLTLAAILSSTASVTLAYWPDVSSRAASIRTFIVNDCSSTRATADPLTTLIHMGSLDSCEMISVHEPDSEPSDGPDQAIESRSFHLPHLQWRPTPADRSSSQTDNQFNGILPGVVNSPGWILQAALKGAWLACQCHCLLNSEQHIVRHFDFQAFLPVHTISISLMLVNLELLFDG
jgi:hypothetical protein